jgi:hypothetical protein
MEWIAGRYREVVRRIEIIIGSNIEKSGVEGILFGTTLERCLM